MGFNAGVLYTSSVSDTVLVFLTEPRGRGSGGGGPIHRGASAPWNEGVANSRYNTLNSTEDGDTDGADAEGASCHHEEDVWRMRRGRTARDKNALKPWDIGFCQSPKVEG